MIRRSFLRRMALAAAACAFIDVPWPKRAFTATEAVERLRLADLDGTAEFWYDARHSELHVRFVDDLTERWHRAALS